MDTNNTSFSSPLQVEMLRHFGCPVGEERRKRRTGRSTPASSVPQKGFGTATTILLGLYR